MELTEISKHIGLRKPSRAEPRNHRPLQGSYEPTRRLIESLAVILEQTPLHISITGHTVTGTVSGAQDCGSFELSADRADVVRLSSRPQSPERRREFPMIPHCRPTVASINHFDARGSDTTARLEAIGFSYDNTVALSRLPSYRRAKFGSFSRFLSVRR